MKIKFRTALLVMLCCSITNFNVNAEMVKYKNYFIPIPDFLECVAEPGFPNSKPRIIVTTDLNGFNTDSDPDDIQSMVHLLASSNKFEIRGITSTPSFVDPTVRSESEHILNIVGAYEQDYLANVNSLRSQGYPTPSQIRSVVKQGELNSVNVKNATFNPRNKRHQGAKLIIDEALAVLNGEKCGPINVLVWGSITDVALALKESERQGLGIERALRVYFIGSTNRTVTIGARESFDYVRLNFLDKDRLWFIQSEVTFRGMFSNRVASSQKSFLDSVTRPVSNRSQSCLGYTLRKASEKIHDEQGLYIKAGDTPSLLHFIDPSWSLDSSYPTTDNWGGEYVLKQGKLRWWIDQNPNTSAINSVSRHLGSANSSINTIYGDWATSMNKFRKILPSNCINSLRPTIN